MRSLLVTALSACTEPSLRAKARRFLGGLSADELQFIAEYLGSSILESTATHSLKLADFHKGIPAGGDDRELKLILLQEYLCRSGVWPQRQSPARTIH